MGAGKRPRVHGFSIWGVNFMHLAKAPGKRRFRLTKRVRDNFNAYLFLLPTLILFCAFTIYPFFNAFYIALCQWDGLTDIQFIGLANYINLFLNDDVFFIAWKNTLLFAVISGPISFFASFIMAWLISNLKKLRNVFSLAFYAPSITSGVAMSTVWLYFFSSDSYGLINNVLIRMGLISEPIKWTLDPQYILGVVVFISIWMGMGTGFLTFLAGLQGLNEEIYEAGMIDGIRNSVQELFYLTLPQMKPQLLFGAINGTVAAFGVFDIAVSVAGMPSPNYAAHTIVAHLYDYAFIRFDMGYASAVAVILFLMTFVLGRVFMKVFSSKDQ